MSGRERISAAIRAVNGRGDKDMSTLQRTLIDAADTPRAGTLR